MTVFDGLGAPAKEKADSVVTLIDEVAIHDHVSFVSRLATAALDHHPDASGLLLIVSIEEVVGGEDRTVAHRFSVSAVDQMVEIIIALAGQPHLNVYMPLALFRASLPARSTGEETHCAAVLALVVDADGDKGRGGRPPVDSPYVVETSAGNFQYVLPLARPLGVAEAKELAGGLVRLTGTDAISLKVHGLWRIPGTPNRPTTRKLKRGRSPEPQLVRVAQEWTGEMIEPEALRAAIDVAPSRADTAVATPSAARIDGPPADSTVQDLLRLLPKHIRLLVAAPAEAGDDRSVDAFSCFATMVRKGFTADQMEAVVTAHPAGIGARYVEGRDLRADMQRAYEKVVLPTGDGGEERSRSVVLLDVMERFRHDPALAGIVAYDQMGLHTLLMHAVPDAAEAGGEFRPRLLADADVSALQCHLQGTGFRKVTRDTMFQALDLLAHENAFHPVHEYLERLQWDGTPRLSGWLYRYLGTESTEYVQSIGRWFLISMVARIYQPGAKVDHMLILEGQQNAGKSSACEILAGDWYSDALPDVTGGKDVSIHLAGKWLLEIGEMSAMSKSETAALKAFITRRTERYRPPYGRNEIEQPRQCVFIGTTNKSTYLRDETGARRFWPVRAGVIDLDALRTDRDQLLAEAVTAFKAGEEWWPSRQFEAEIISKEQAERFEADVWAEPIAAYLSGKDVITISDVLREALVIPASKSSTSDQRRATAVIEWLGWERRGRVTGGRTAWRRPVQ